jgi:hypothetical protein
MSWLYLYLVDSTSIEVEHVRKLKNNPAIDDRYS